MASPKRFMRDLQDVLGSMRFTIQTQIRIVLRRSFPGVRRVTGSTNGDPHNEDDWNTLEVTNKFEAQRAISFGLMSHDPGYCNSRPSNDSFHTNYLCFPW